MVNLFLVLSHFFSIGPRGRLIQKEGLYRRLNVLKEPNFSKTLLEDLNANNTFLTSLTIKKIVPNVFFVIIREGASSVIRYDNRYEKQDNTLRLSEGSMRIPPKHEKRLINHFTSGLEATFKQIPKKKSLI